MSSDVLHIWKYLLRFEKPVLPLSLCAVGGGWREAIVALPHGTFQVMFSASKGKQDSGEGDIALDTISIYQEGEGPAPPPEPTQPTIKPTTAVPAAPIDDTTAALVDLPTKQTAPPPMTDMGRLI
jgi:hypothetical protein